VEGPLPLTPIQHWFFGLGAPAASHWNQALMLAADGLELAPLTRAAEALTIHHDALRLRFRHGASGWEARIVGPPAGEVRVDEIDLSAEGPESRAAALAEIAAEAQAGLDLAAGPIVRWVLVHLGREEGDRLLWVIHHLAVDAIAWRVLLADLESAYRQARDGEAVALPAKTTSLQRWARRLEEHTRGGGFDGELAHWMADAAKEAPSLPRDRDGDNLEGSAETVHVSLDEATSRAVLQEIGKVFKTQINDVLLAALLEALAPWIGERRLRVDLEGHGREAPFDDVDVSRTVGWFTTIFPVFLDAPEVEPDETLHAVQQQLAQVPGRGFGYGALRSLHGDEQVRRRLQRAQRAEVSFLYLGQLDGSGGGAGLFRPAAEGPGPTQHPAGHRSHLLQINSSVAAGRLEMDWIFSRQVHDRSTIAALAESYLAALRRFVEASREASGDQRLKADLSRFGWSSDEVSDVFAQLAGD
jgi:non-ribosomal peptide synthase protein (TIGR01720 family)